MYIKYIHMYITVHQVQLPERGHRAAAPVQQTQYSSVHQYISTARALSITCSELLSCCARHHFRILLDVLLACKCASDRHC